MNRLKIFLISTDINKSLSEIAKRRVLKLAEKLKATTFEPSVGYKESRCFANWEK